MTNPIKPALLCLALAAVCPLQAAPVTQLKVMSFNIWVNGGQSLSKCIDAINTSGADLVGLQECNATTAQTIATNLGFHVLPAGDCSIGSGQFTCPLGSLSAGSSTTVTVVGTPLAAGQLVYDVSVSGAEPDGHAANNAGTFSTTVIGAEGSRQR